MSQFGITIRRIAQALGVPVEALDQSAGDAKHIETNELLRAWFSIDSAQGRRRLIQVARQEAERSAMEKEQGPAGKADLD